MNGTKYVENCTKIQKYIYTYMLESHKEQCRRYYDMKCGFWCECVCVCVWVNMGLSFCEHRRHRL